MNKQMKQHLEAVVEAIIFDDAAAAKDAFHNYLSLKTQSILVGEACEDEECEDDKSDDKEEDKSDDKEDKKEDKKSDKKEDKSDDKKSDKKDDKKDEGDEE